MEIAKGIIGNALTSAATDHVVAVANDVYDEHLEKYQSEINSIVNTNDGTLASVRLACYKIVEILTNTTFSTSADLEMRLRAVKNELDSLGDGYKTLKEVSQTLKNFITAADTSDQTINTWKEIETFLNGITDTDTLTGLLKELKDDLEAKIIACGGEIPNVKVFVLESGRDNQDIYDYYAEHPEGTFIQFKDLDQLLFTKVTQHNTGNLRTQAVFDQNNKLIIATIKPIGFYTSTQTIQAISIPTITNSKLGSNSVTIDKLSDDLQDRINQSIIFTVTATSDNTELLEYVNEHTADNVLIRYIGENRDINNVVSDLYIFAIERYTLDHIYTNNQILNTHNYKGLYRLYITSNKTAIQSIRPVGSDAISYEAIGENHLTDLVADKLNSTLIQHPESDVDNLKTPGIYLIQNFASGQRPGVLLVAKENTALNTIYQTWINTYTGLIKTRYYAPSTDTWQSWQYSTIDGITLKLGTVLENRLDANLRNKLVNTGFYNSINNCINTGIYNISEVGYKRSILVVYNAGDNIYQTYYKADYSIVYRSSTDGGVTWSEQTIKLNGDLIEDKTITINKLADDVLPKNTSDLVNDSDFVTSTEVDNRIKQIVGAAPEALDTLEEIAAKLTDNDDIHAGLVNSISEKASKEELDNIAATIPNIKVFEINNTDNSELFNYIEEHGYKDVYIKYNLTYDNNVYNYLLKIATVLNDRVISEIFITPQRYIYNVTVHQNNFSASGSELSYASIPKINNTKIVDKTITSDKLADGVIPDIKLFVVSNDSDNTALFEYINADADNYKKVIISYQTDTTSILTNIAKVVNEGYVKTNSFKVVSDFVNINIYTNRCTVNYETDLYGRNIANNTIEETKLSSNVKAKLNNYQYFELQYGYDDRNIETFQKIYEAYTSGNKHIVVGIQDSDLNVIIANVVRVVDENTIIFKFINNDDSNYRFSIYECIFKNDGSYSFGLCYINGNYLVNNSIVSNKIADKAITKEKLSDEVLNILDDSKFFVIEVENNKVINLDELIRQIDYSGPDGDRPIGVYIACIIKENGRYYPITNTSGNFLYYRAGEYLKVISVLDGTITYQSYGDLTYITNSNIVNNTITENKLSQEVINKLNDTPTKTSQLTNDSNFATTEDINTAISELIAGAPEELDTLKEISEALQDDQDAISGLVTTISTKANKTDLSNIIGDVTEDTVQLKDKTTNSEIYPITTSDQVKIGDTNLTKYITEITTEEELDNLAIPGVYYVCYSLIQLTTRKSSNYPNGLSQEGGPHGAILVVSRDPNVNIVTQTLYLDKCTMNRYNVGGTDLSYSSWADIYPGLKTNSVNTNSIANRAVTKEKLATDLYNELSNESKVFTISIDNKETTELFNYLENGGDTDKVIIKLVDKYNTILAIAGIYSYDNNTVTTNPVIINSGVFMIEFYKENDYNYVPYNINGLYIDNNSIDINKLRFDPYERSNNPITTINNLTALINAPNKYGTYRLNINNNATLDVDMYNLNEAYIIIKNTSTAARQIAIPVSDTVISMSGDVLQIPAEAYVELSIIKDTVNNISYIRFA